MISRVVDGDLTRELRRRVMRPNLAPSDELPGDGVEDLVHFATFDDAGALIGACFIAPRACPWLSGDAPAWGLRQMATRPDRRRSGVGSSLLAAIMDFVGVPALIWCHARVEAADFYLRHGFVIDSDEYIDADTGMPHVRMHLTVVCT